MNLKIKQNNQSKMKMNKIQTQTINKCLGKYISLLLSTQQSSIPLKIIQSEN